MTPEMKALLLDLRSAVRSYQNDRFVTQPQHRAEIVAKAMEVADQFERDEEL